MLILLFSVQTLHGQLEGCAGLHPVGLLVETGVHGLPMLMLLLLTVVSFLVEEYVLVVLLN